MELWPTLANTLTVSFKKIIQLLCNVSGGDSAPAVTCTSLWSWKQLMCGTLAVFLLLFSYFVEVLKPPEFIILACAEIFSFL
jgi:hypothetical protein